MTRVEDVTPASPERIWEVLSDPESYEYWVVGCKRIRRADPEWPAQGALFHHAVGAGPLTIRDHTEVVASVPPQVLRLRAKARPFGTFFVTLQLVPEEVGGRTRVIMDEEPADRLTRLVFGPLARVGIRVRNVASVGRLKDLVEGRGPGAAEAG